MPRSLLKENLVEMALIIWLGFFSHPVFAGSERVLDVLGEEFTLQHYPANISQDQNQLMLFIAPGYGFNVRSVNAAKALSELGIEVWMVDLAENLFLPISNETTHTFDGRYVAELIRALHKKTGKNITLMSSSFGAIPALRGARQWQLSNPKNAYLNGALFFSPEVYQSIPALGVDPEFEPVVSATNIPVMIYQSEFRNNRWQLENVVSHLQKSNAIVYQKILPGIVSFFYEIDEFPETLRTLRELPKEIPGVIRMLESTPTPLVAAEIAQPTEIKRTGSDIKLKKYKGNRVPLPLNLENINGERIVRKDYKGKVTVVNFWATWCPPCVEEIPMLNRLREKMAGHDFELLSVNFGQEKAVIDDFLKKVHVKFPVLLDVDGSTAGSWNTIVLPSTFVIGPDGKFAYAVNAAIEWDSPETVEALKRLSPR